MRHRGFRPENYVSSWRRPNSDGSPERTRTLIFPEVVYLHFAFHLSNPVTRPPNRALSAIHRATNSGLRYQISSVVSFAGLCSVLRLLSRPPFVFGAFAAPLLHALTPLRNTQTWISPCPSSSSARKAAWSTTGFLQISYLLQFDRVNQLSLRHLWQRTPYTIDRIFLFSPRHAAVPYLWTNRM